MIGGIKKGKLLLYVFFLNLYMYDKTSNSSGQYDKTYNRLESPHFQVFVALVFSYEGSWDHEESRAYPSHKPSCMPSDAFVFPYWLIVRNIYHLMRLVKYIITKNRIIYNFYVKALSSYIVPSRKHRCL